MLTDEKIIESFNAIAESGHPDPLGFIARGQVKTGLSFDGEYKGAVGSFGVSKKQAIHAGYDEEDVLSTQGNMIAGVEVDLNNFRKADGDVDGMYRLSNDANKKSTNRFMKRLEKEKQSLHERMVFDDNGSLVQIRKKQKNDALDITKTVNFSEDGKIISAVNKKDSNISTDRARMSKDGKRVIYSRTDKNETADDIVKKTKEYVFRSEDKKKIDDMLQHLVGIIIDEKPLSSLSK